MWSLYHQFSVKLSKKYLTSHFNKKVCLSILSIMNTDKVYIHCYLSVTSQRVGIVFVGWPPNPNALIWQAPIFNCYIQVAIQLIPPVGGSISPIIDLCAGPHSASLLPRLVKGCWLTLILIRSYCQPVGAS